MSKLVPKCLSGSTFGNIVKNSKQTSSIPTDWAEIDDSEKFGKYYMDLEGGIYHTAPTDSEQSSNFYNFIEKNKAWPSTKAVNNAIRRYDELIKTGAITSDPESTGLVLDTAVVIGKRPDWLKLVIIPGETKYVNLQQQGDEQMAEEDAEKRDARRRFTNWTAGDLITEGFTPLGEMSRWTSKGLSTLGGYLAKGMAYLDLMKARLAGYGGDINELSYLSSAEKGGLGLGSFVAEFTPWNTLNNALKDPTTAAVIAGTAGAGKFISPIVRKATPYFTNIAKKPIQLANKISNKVLNTLTKKIEPTLQQKQDFIDAFKNQMVNGDVEYLDWLHNLGITDIGYDGYYDRAKDFVRQQMRSARGVIAPSLELAEKYLVETRRGKKLGGDMLGTLGGLYTANDNTIANLINKSNSEGILDNGAKAYTATLEMDLPANFDNMSGKEALLYYYNKVQALPESSYTYEYNKALLKQGVKAVETPYGENGLLRAYLPNYETGRVERPVKITELNIYDDIKDLPGKLGSLHSEANPNLFVPRLLHRSDFGTHWKAFNNLRIPIFGEDGNRFIGNAVGASVITTPVPIAAYSLKLAMNQSK